MCALLRYADGMNNGIPHIALATTYEVKEGDTWTAIAMRHYGDAMLGGSLAEMNGAGQNTKPRPGVTLRLPPPDEINRRVVEGSTAYNNIYGAGPDKHILPQREIGFVDENSVAKDARARLARARVGMGLHAKGGGWRPVEFNAEDQKKKPKKKKPPEPELEDQWLRKLARLSPRSAMKVAKVCGAKLGTGPTLTLLGNLREADNSDERMGLIERFLQAYGNDANETVKQLLRAVAWQRKSSSDKGPGPAPATPKK